jgi:hypothetical protein
MTAAYRLAPYSLIIRNNDGAVIPNDADNADRITYDAWVAAGNTPDPVADPPTTETPAASALSITDKFILRQGDDEDKEATLAQLQYLLINENDALLYIGGMPCAANPGYPDADAGHVYRVISAGKIGGSSGISVEVGDLMLCLVDSSLSGSQAAVGSHWTIVHAGVTQAAIDLKANLASPALTGTPTAPTASAGTNTTQLANTAFVQAALTALIGGAPGALDTLKELADAINDDASYAATITAALALKAPLNSPALTGAPTAPSPSLNTNSTQLATTQFVMSQVPVLFDTYDVVQYKGTMACASNPGYPDAEAGHWYYVSSAGKIGGASGLTVEIGDMFLCIVDGSLSGSQAAVGANWTLRKRFSNVDNTSDANKPVSTAQATAIAAKANLSTSSRVRLVATGVNFAAAAGDIVDFDLSSILWPTGALWFGVVSLRIFGASATLATTPASIGGWTAAGGTGVRWLADTAATVSATATGTANNTQQILASNQNTQAYLISSTGHLFVRLVTPNGSAATASVEVELIAF